MVTPAALRCTKTRRSLALLSIAALRLPAALCACGGAADASNASNQNPTELAIGIPPGTKDGELGQETEPDEGYFAEAAGAEVKQETPRTTSVWSRPSGRVTWTSR